MKGLAWSMVAADRNGKLAGDVERRGHVLELSKASHRPDRRSGIDTGPDYILARLQMVAEVGDKYQEVGEIDPTPTQNVAVANAAESRRIDECPCDITNPSAGKKFVPPA